MLTNAHVQMLTYIVHLQHILLTAEDAFEPAGLTQTSDPHEAGRSTLLHGKDASFQEAVNYLGYSNRYRTATANLLIKQANKARYLKIELLFDNFLEQ